ncbi:GIY-YIG nuclease family protein [Parasphingorhabdus cellanae]|uniref:GIY-YIG nuclease family protein n=2 Tax=Parasphingorhabdus cellanae TaxID=2806553 RepID=A0ABX7T9V4_9SPHN|nr:GIY-YIG nuclease family protein [Parasphingorhabdus cellanae]QTD57830.1 GIY-YIG nuclease family protein [Parasphingorhabdus cellanae]
MLKPGFVYMMANRRNGPIYIGSTSDLIQRVYQHRNRLIEGFTKTYHCCLLVWFKAYDDIQEARDAERRMKKWNRPWKIKRIENGNPDWRDLWPDIIA